MSLYISNKKKNVKFLEEHQAATLNNTSDILKARMMKTLSQF